MMCPSPSQSCLQRLLVSSGERIQGQTQRGGRVALEGKFIKIQVHSWDGRAGELQGEMGPLRFGFPSFIDKC